MKAPVPTNDYVPVTSHRPILASVTLSYTLFDITEQSQNDAAATAARSIEL
jgi:cytochrome c oxidase assembly protein Cox11